MAGSSSDAGGMDVASEHVAEDGENDSNDIMMNLISFNFGLGQGMFAKRKYAEKCALWFLCVGPHVCFLLTSGLRCS